MEGSHGELDGWILSNADVTLTNEGSKKGGNVMIWARIFGQTINGLIKIEIQKELK